MGKEFRNGKVGHFTKGIGMKVRWRERASSFIPIKKYMKESFLLIKQLGMEDTSKSTVKSMKANGSTISPTVKATKFWKMEPNNILENSSKEVNMDMVHINGEIILAT